MKISGLILWWLFFKLSCIRKGLATKHWFHRYMVRMYNTEGVLVGLLMPSRTGRKQKQTLYIAQAPLRLEDKHFTGCHSSRFLALGYRSVEPSPFFWAYFVFRESGGIWLWCPNFLQGLCITCNAGRLHCGDNLNDSVLLC